MGRKKVTVSLSSKCLELIKEYEQTTGLEARSRVIEEAMVGQSPVGVIPTPPTRLQSSFAESIDHGWQIAPVMYVRLDDSHHYDKPKHHRRYDLSFETAEEL